MSNGNLLKFGWNAVKQDVLVIDTNDMIARKMKEISASMQKEAGEDGFSEGIVGDLDAVKVAQLLQDGEAAVSEGEAQEQAPRSNLIKAIPLYEGPGADEMLRQAKEELENAQQQAQEILEDAREQAELMKKHGYNEGYKAGQQEGYQEGMEKISAGQEELARKEISLEAAYQEQIDKLEPMFIDTLTGIYEQVFQIDLKKHREIIVHLIGSALHSIEGTKDFIIHVSRDDYPYVSMQKKQLLSNAIAANATIEVVEDAVLNKSQCMIETGGGVFDCSIDTELDELSSRLKLLSYEKQSDK